MSMLCSMDVPGRDEPGRGGRTEGFSLSFTAEFTVVEGVLSLVEEWAAELGVYKDDRTSLRLVLEELLLNLCLHVAGAAGGKALTTTLEIAPVLAFAENPQDAARPQRLVVTLEDTGPEFDPLLQEGGKVSTIRQTPPGGHGLTLVRLLTTELDYSRRHGSNVLKLVLVCNGPGTAPSSDPPGTGTSVAEAFSGPGGLPALLRRLWDSRLAVRQTVFFFCISLFMVWGGLFFYALAARDSRLENSRKLCMQALHTQNVSSTTFLERLARNFAEFTERIAELPDYPAILDDDYAFFKALQDGVLIRTVTADTAVFGVLKGKKGEPDVMLLYRAGDAVSYFSLPLDVDALVEKSVSGEAPAWSGPIRNLPGDTGQGHAGMMLCKVVRAEPGSEVWVGVLITMPWVVATLDTLSGFEHVASVFVTQQGEYVGYPPGRNVYGGPQRLAEEAVAGAAPGMRLLIDAIARRRTGIIPLEDIFPGGDAPWPLPWEGAGTLAYAPMTMPGWSFILLVSSEEAGRTPPGLPPSMIILAVCAPFLVALIAWRVSSGVILPLGRLSEALKRITEGDLDTPLPKTTQHDEISGMLRAFEHVRVTLKHSFANLMEATAAEQRVRNELALARAIQESMLPASPPDIPGIRLAASIDMAGDVCGDLFDCFTLPDAPDVLYCLIGDVCGKGIPASVIMSRAMVLARSVLLSGETLSRTLSRLNDGLLRFNDSLMFVTLLVGRLDGATGEFSWASAGHPPPILGGTAFREQPRISGVLPWTRELVLGVKPGCAYAEQSVQLAPGQSVLLYTDGADEAMAPAGPANGVRPGQSEGMHIFGADRLQAVFASACAADAGGNPPGPGAVLGAVRAALLAHMNGLAPSDDISLIVIRWDGSAPCANRFSL